MRLTADDEAFKLMATQAFRDDWRRLHERSRYGTVYQSFEFCRAWYESYRSLWSPVLVWDGLPNGPVRSLWALARHRSTGELAHAGAHQAEYHTWLHEDEGDLDFAAAAWALLRRELGVRTLRFRYFPDSAGAERIAQHRALGGLADVRVNARPLLRIDAEGIASSFSKKSNKSRFNRLAKLGVMEFRRVRDLPDLEGVLDDLVLCYDFRQGAVNGVEPFREDAVKRLFHRAVFDQANDQTHLTVTTIDGRAVAGLWGQVSGKTLHLGILFHSPVLAEHSPGKLHVMKLSQLMVQEGLTTLDLTPGGDPWKERFATDHDAVADITLHESEGIRRMGIARESSRQTLKRTLGKVGTTPDQVRDLLASARRATPEAVIRKAKTWLGEEREFRAYRVDRSLALDGPDDERIRRNDLTQILAFEPSERWHSREAFLSSALSRLEAGEAAYTAVIDGRLAHFGWLALAQETSFLSEVECRVELPPGSATLYDFYTHPAHRGQGLYRANLRRMLRDAFRDANTTYAYIFVLADNGPSRRAIEDIGFQYVRSYGLRRRFGETTKWVDPPLPVTETTDQGLT